MVYRVRLRVDMVKCAAMNESTWTYCIDYRTGVGYWIKNDQIVVAVGDVK